ncbi:MAG: hypothetical protein WAW73_17840 [Rhodoferax sp.]
MYLNIDGFNKINDRIQTERQLELDNQRRAVQDARAAEAFGRQQKDWGLQDAYQAEVGNQAQELLTGLASAKGYDWRQAAGVQAPAPTESNPAPGLAAPTNRAAVDQYSAPAGAAPQQGEQQAPLGLASAKMPQTNTGNPMDDQRKMVENMVKLAAASRDPQQLAKAQAAWGDHQKRRVALEISNHLDSATPEELERMANAITADPTNKVKAVYDRATGFTKLETDSGVQTLRKGDLKNYLIAQAQGNIDGMTAAQNSHAARTDKDNAFTEKMVDSNNKVTYESGQLNARRAQVNAEQGKPPAGYRKTAGGNLEAIPGGPADMKLQGAFNQDTAALTGATSSFDRLATAANEVLNHPGLTGITGLRGKIPNMPGTDAANAEALLATLKSQVGFGVLQDMRNNSKTGGALGSVSDAEGKRLEANLAALDKAQSLDQYKTQLKKIIDYAEQAKGRMRESFNLRHPVDGQPRSPQPPKPEGSSGSQSGSAGGQAAPIPRAKSQLQVGGVYMTGQGPAKWNGTAFEVQ